MTTYHITSTMGLVHHECEELADAEAQVHKYCMAGIRLVQAKVTDDLGRTWLPQVSVTLTPAPENVFQRLWRQWRLFDLRERYIPLADDVHDAELTVDEMTPDEPPKEEDDA